MTTVDTCERFSGHRREALKNTRCRPNLDVLQTVCLVQYFREAPGPHQACAIIYVISAGPVEILTMQGRAPQCRIVRQARAAKGEAFVS